MQKSLAGKTFSKLAKVFCDRVKTRESVEIQFTDDSNFIFIGSYKYTYESDGDWGDDNKFKDFNGQGIYEVIGYNCDRKETIIKLVFSKLSRKETEMMRRSDTVERESEDSDFTLVLHFLDIYGTDLYIEQNEILHIFKEDRLFINLWNDEIKLLVESGVSQEQAYESIYNFIHTDRDSYSSHFDYDHSVIQIFAACIPEFNYQHFNELQNCLMCTVYSDKVSTVHQQLAEWKKAGYRLSNFVKNNNLEEFAEKLMNKVLDRNQDNVPEYLQL